MDGGLEDPLTMVNARMSDGAAWHADDPVLLLGFLLVAVELLAVFALL
ncbi:hypothetical protein [Halarchaeum sp. P4]